MKSVDMDWIPGSKFLDPDPTQIGELIDSIPNDSVLDAKRTGNQMKIQPDVEESSRNLESFILVPHIILPGGTSLPWTFNMRNYSSWVIQRNKDRKILENTFEEKNLDGLRKRTYCTSQISTFGEQTCAIPVMIGDRKIGVHPIELRTSAESMRENSVEECGIEPDSSSFEKPEEIGVKKIGNKYPIVLLRRLKFPTETIRENSGDLRINPDSSVQLNNPEEQTYEKPGKIEVRKMGNKYPIVLLRRLKLPTDNSSKHTKVKNKHERESNDVIDDEVESIFRGPPTKSRRRTLYSPCTFEKSDDMAKLFSDVINE